MRIPVKLLAVAGASAMMLGLGSGAAFAGDHPTPPPVVTPQTCTPTPRPITFAPTVSPTDQVSPAVAHGSFPSDKPTVTPTPTPPVATPRCATERFVAQVTTVGNLVTQNRVVANGPVFGTGTLDLPVQTNTFDRFRLPSIFRAVNVPHTGILFPAIYPNLCAVSVTQLGVWRFNGGPVFSLFRHAIGNGTYLLTGQWVFPTIRGICSLRFIRGNPLLQNRINPTYSNIQVVGVGLAAR